MNERIEKLITEAFFDESANVFEEKMYTLGERKMQLFAELIIRECLSYAKDGDLDFMKFMIKKHFGVEE